MNHKAFILLISSLMLINAPMTVEAKESISLNQEISSEASEAEIKDAVKDALAQALRDSMSDYTITINRNAKPGERLQIDDSKFAQSLLDKINRERANQGLDALELDQGLCEIADIRANEILTKMSHTRPDGTYIWDLTDAAGYSYNVGENLGLNYSSPSGVFNGWMNSPTHYEVITTAEFKICGIAYEKQPNSTKYSWCLVCADKS